MANLSHAYVDGQNARRYEQPPVSPYNKGTDQDKAWLKGWNEVDAQLKGTR